MVAKRNRRSDESVVPGLELVPLKLGSATLPDIDVDVVDGKANLYVIV